MNSLLDGRSGPPLDQLDPIWRARNECSKKAEL